MDNDITEIKSSRIASTDKVYFIRSKFDEGLCVVHFIFTLPLLLIRSGTN